MPRLPDHPTGKEITLELEGHSIPAHEGESVATALLACDETTLSRSVKYHRPRGPFCMSGACSHCLMRVDGVPNVFTCRTKVRAGMRLERQNAYPSAEHDVFGAIDWLFPKGLDHHEMFAGVPVAEQVMQKVARHLAGLGLLPEKPAPARMPQEVLTTKVAIVGGGAAGLAAARELDSAGVDFLLLERDERIGGRMVTGALGQKDPPLSAFSPAVNGRTRLSTVAIGLFNDARGRFLCAVQWTPEGPRLLSVYAERFLLATGGYPSQWPFENNDVPGVFAGRAVSLLIRRDGFVPGESFALVGTGPELYDLGRLIEERGAKVVAVIDVAEEPPTGVFSGRAHRGEPVKAHGRTQVRGLSFKTAAGRTERVSCDAVAICIPASPAFELARQGGAEIVFADAHQGFVVEADANGKTKSDDVYVAGDLLGGSTIAKAADSGAKAGRAVAASLSAGGAK